MVFATELWAGEVRAMHDKPATPSGVPIIDNEGVAEVFATSIVDVTLINAHAISVTFGARRNTRETSASDPQEAIFVNSRVVLPVEAAQVFSHLLSRMLRRAEELRSQPKEPAVAAQTPPERPRSRRTVS
jgi:hypothetical protein